MAPFGLTRTITHPYQDIYPESHGHFAPTRYEQAAYSAACIPFRWMLREQVEGSPKQGEIGIAERLKLGWVPEREPDIRNRQGVEIETAWFSNMKTNLRCWTLSLVRFDLRIHCVFFTRSGLLYPSNPDA